jgi:hypothetical protein
MDGAGFDWRLVGRSSAGWSRGQFLGAGCARARRVVEARRGQCRALASAVLARRGGGLVRLRRPWARRARRRAAARLGRRSAGRVAQARSRRAFLAASVLGEREVGEGETQGGRRRCCAGGARGYGCVRS